MTEGLSAVNEVCFFLTQERWSKLKKNCLIICASLAARCCQFWYIKRAVCLKSGNGKNHPMIISEVTLINTASFLKLFMQKYKCAINSKHNITQVSLPKISAMTENRNSSNS